MMLSQVTPVTLLYHLAYFLHRYISIWNYHLKFFFCSLLYLLTPTHIFHSFLFLFPIHEIHGKAFLLPVHLPPPSTKEAMLAAHRCSILLLPMWSIHANMGCSNHRNQDYSSWQTSLLNSKFMYHHYTDGKTAAKKVILALVPCSRNVILRIKMYTLK